MTNGQPVDDRESDECHATGITQGDRAGWEAIVRLDGAALDATLQDLWRRRTDLNQAEWTALYRIVTRVLRQGSYPQLGTLRESRDWYIQSFFVDKVFRFDQTGEIFYAGALKTFFRNYLLSQLRTLGPPAPDTADADGQDPASVEEANETTADRTLVDQIAALVEKALPGVLNDAPGTPVHAVQRHLGVSLPRVIESARGFLAGTDEWAGLVNDAWWIRIYLREHQCPEHGVALSLLAQRHQIRSSHHKALKLGVTVPKGDAAALAAFTRSLRGQWLRSLGIAVDSSHQLEMMLALKILCILALLEAGGG